MAVHNGGVFLDRSIQSIAWQTFADWELVLVDDASTDDSVHLARQWAEKDSRIRVLSNSINQGQTASLNEGLDVCRGRWIARQDADDISHPRRIAAQMEYLRENPGTVLLGTQGKLIDQEGKLVGLLDVPLDEDSIRWCAPFLNPFLHTAVVFDRETVQSVGAYDPTYRIAQDYEFWTRICDRHSAANLPERLIFYRNTETSLSRSGPDLAFAEADRVSARTAMSFFGRPWTEQEDRVVSEFRRGLSGLRRNDFWELLESLQREKRLAFPSRLRAAWHLRSAGFSREARLAEILSAFVADPRFTISWLAERFSGFSNPDA